MASPDSHPRAPLRAGLCLILLVAAAGATPAQTGADGGAPVVMPALSVAPLCAPVGQEITLRVSGGVCFPDPRVEYQFDFGNGTLSEWLPGVPIEAPALATAAPRRAAPLPDPANDLAARRRDVERLLPAVREEGVLRVIVAFDGAAALDLSSAAVDRPREYRRLPLAAAAVDEEGLLRLADLDRVRRVWRDELRQPHLAETIPAIGAPTVWSFGSKGRGQAIAVLDTGVDGTHPMLAGRVVAEACFSTTDYGYRATSLCPLGRDYKEGAGSAAPCTLPGCEHGTHVAGIAAGSGAPLAGVAPEASIVAVQVFARFDDSRICGRSGSCVASFVSDQLAALDWLLDRHAGMGLAAVNMSLGGGISEFACDDLDPTAVAIEALREAGVPTVISAGNDRSRGASYPACVSSAVSVGAVDDTGRGAEFTNYGPLVPILAPGVGVRSSVPGGGVLSLSGTSMAAPHVAGTIALLRERNPAATFEEIVRALGTWTALPVDVRARYLSPRLHAARAWGAIEGEREAQVEHAWPSSTSNVDVRARARCAADPGSISDWSEPASIEFGTDPLRAYPPSFQAPLEPALTGDLARLTIWGGGVESYYCVDWVWVEVDWGDGTPGEILPPYAGYAQHRYRDAGTYSVRSRAHSVSEEGLVSVWSGPVQVQVDPAALPDYRASWRTLKRLCRGKGASLSCTMKGKLTVKNEGRDRAPGTFIEMQLRGASEAMHLERTGVVSLARGQSIDLRVSFSLPPGVRGSGNWIVAVLDPMADTRELDESNNEALYGPLK